MNHIIRLITFSDKKEIYINADKIVYFKAHIDGGTLVRVSGKEIHIKDEPEQLEGRLSYLYDDFPEPF